MASINFQPVAYSQVSKMQKLAILMIVIGDEASATLMNDFDEEVLESLSCEIAQIYAIDHEIRNLVITEFTELIMESLNSTLGGFDFLKKALLKAKGEIKATGILSRITPAKSSVDLIEEIREMDTRKVFNLLKNEQAQTIAFVLSNLRIQQVGEIMSMFTPELKEEIVERLGTMGMTSMEIVGRVVDSLKSHADDAQKTSLYQSGGVNQLAEVLNTFPKDETKELLAKLEERNPQLTEAVRKRMFGFEDLIRLQPGDLQRIIREVEMDDLIKALKSAQASLQSAFFKCMSKRAAEDLKQEILMVTIKKKDSEAAQDKIIKAARALEEQGDISLDQDDEETL